MDPLLQPDLIDDPTRSATAEPARASSTAARRRSWARHAVLGATALGAAGLFLVISRSLDTRHANRFDHAVMRAAGRARSAPRTTFVVNLTNLGGVAGIVALSLGAVLGSMKRSPRAAAQIALGALGGISAELGLKQIFGRARPTILPHLQRVASKSFPSGHAMASASFYPTLALVASRGRRLRDVRVPLLATSALLAAAVGGTRVYLGVHWPTDVLGGLALGTAWAWGLEAAFDYTGARKIERAIEKPHLFPPAGAPTVA
jgi:membrane-associated phospholipid phosphatase